ncbi:MAG: winged helix-turn-helix domain-containing protein [Pyrinomonadaceae bacterium]
MNLKQQNPSTLQFDEFTLHPNEELFFKNSEQISLTPKAFELLRFFVMNEGRLLTKDEILNRVWKDSFVEEGTLARTVSTIRTALGKDARGIIVTVPKKGYRFTATVKQNDLSTQPAFEFVETDAQVAFPLVENNSETIDIRDPRNLRAFVLAALGILIAGLIGGFLWYPRYVEQTSVASPTFATKQITNSNEDERFLGWTNDDKIVFDRGKSNQLYIVNPDGSGETKVIANIPQVKEARIAPDKSKVVYSKTNVEGAFIANLDGTAEEKLPFSFENMAWSADGTKIVFQEMNGLQTAQNNADIFIYSFETKQITRLTKNNFFDGDANFSPDANEVVFSSDRDGNLEIYLMNVDGSNVRRLTDNPANDSFPRFAPDGTQITFNSNRKGESTDVYLMNKSGANEVRLTDSESNSISRGGISPDGTKLAFNSNQNGVYSIFVKDIEPFSSTLILSAESNLQTPSFSPDGKEIVFSTTINEKSGEIRILNLRDKSTRVLLKTTSGKNYPRWSNDGSWIVFHQKVEEKWDIYKIRVDGTELTRLTTHPASDSLPNWFADDKSIVFRSTRNGDATLSEFYKMKSDGTEQVPLSIAKGNLGWETLSPDSLSIVYSCSREQLRGGKLQICVSNTETNDEQILLNRAEDNIHSSFSYDGKKIAFVANSDGNPEIYMMNFDGTGLLRLTRNLKDDENPVFAPDGKSIVFSSNRNGKFALFSIDISNLNQ